MEKMKVSGAMLASAKKAEEALARDEAKRLGGDLPEGHPLKAEVERQKAILGGDLSGLPAGHPLMLEIEAAKKAREARQEAAKAEKAGGEAAGVKKAKRLDVEEAARKKRLAEDDATDKRREAAGEVNRRMEELVRMARELRELVAEKEQEMGQEPVSKAKRARLARILMAAERGVSGCRMVRI